jgi:hypothetical protein
MGENRNKTRTVVVDGVTYKLTDAMIGALESGRPSFGTANVLGRSGTIVALIERGLVTAGRTHQWTQAGYKVASAVLSGRTPTWAEGHPAPIQPSTPAYDGEGGVIARGAAPEAIELDLPALGHPITLDELDEQLADRVETEAEQAAREVSASGGGLDEWARRQQLAGRTLRTTFDPARLTARSCCSSTEGDVHNRECQTPAARKQWGPAALRTQSERAPEAAPQQRIRERIEPGDLVTVDGADPRVWRVERVEPGNGYSTGEPYGALVHVSGTRTAVPIIRLTHATAAEILRGERTWLATGREVLRDGGDPRVWTIASIVPGDPAIGVKSWASLVHHPTRYETITTTASLDRLSPAPATSQPATSQTAAEQDAGVFLAHLADLIRSTGAIPPPQPPATPDEREAALVKRAQYDALRAVLRAMGDDSHLGVGDLGENQFDHDDVRRMVADAACELGVRWSR